MLFALRGKPKSVPESNLVVSGQSADAALAELIQEARAWLHFAQGFCFGVGMVVVVQLAFKVFPL